MTLVRHFERGYGHAVFIDEYWRVYFFDDYDTPVIFSKYARYHKLLHFLTEDFDNDE